MLGRLLNSVPRAVVCCPSAVASSSSVPASFAVARRSMHSSAPIREDSKDTKPTGEVAQTASPSISGLKPEDTPIEHRTLWEQEREKERSRKFTPADHASLVFAPPADIPRPKDLSAYIDPTTGELYPASLLPRAPKPTPADVSESRHTRQYKNELVTRPDHPLWAFFHKDKNGKPTAMEKVEKEDTEALRPWKASELRLKSFQDLHTLWFLLLREKNIYYTQKAERRRRGLKNESFGTHTYRMMIQLSMARIKFVASERNQVYKAAAFQAARERAAKEDEEERLMIEAGHEFDEMDLEGADAREAAEDEADGELGPEEEWVEEGKQDSAKVKA